jgi:DNA-binding NtrC family response regulator
MARILIVDDERSIRSTLREILEFENYEVDEAADGAEGLEKLKTTAYDMVLCDIKMPKLDGLEVLEQGLAARPDTTFIMISGHGDIDTAVEATRKGAYDFLQKPPDLNRLLIAIRNGLEKTTLVTETKRLKRKVTGVREIVGQSEGIRKIKETIERVGPTDARVLITGENGTGKELIARWLHEHSPRAQHPIVEVNCAAIPSELIESELFGHEKGAFTSAVKQRIGKFEQAHGGTLFLDEIGDMSHSAQAKVLRALQENRITRVGGDKDIQVDVRIVAATNKDLHAEIAAGRFREDLYHRLSVIIIHNVPLRERRDDIPLLAQHFLQEIAQEYNQPRKTITDPALAELQQQDWTGNVRELRNVMERLHILSGKQIELSDVSTYAQGRRAKAADLSSLFAQYDKFQDFKDFLEREFIHAKLKQYNWNMSKTAEALDIQRSHLYTKVEKYGLQRAGGAAPEE